MQQITIDGRLVFVTLDFQGRIISVYSPYYTDPFGNPLVTSFGYGQATDNIEAWVRRLIEFLGLTPVPLP